MAVGSANFAASAPSWWQGAAISNRELLVAGTTVGGTLAPFVKKARFPSASGAAGHRLVPATRNCTGGQGRTWASFPRLRLPDFRAAMHKEAVDSSRASLVSESRIAAEAQPLKGPSVVGPDVVCGRAYCAWNCLDLLTAVLNTMCR